MTFNIGDIVWWGKPYGSRSDKREREYGYIDGLNPERESVYITAFKDLDKFTLLIQDLEAGYWGPVE